MAANAIAGAGSRCHHRCSHDRCSWFQCYAHYGGYFLSFNVLYVALAVTSWPWFTPDMSHTGTFSVGWIAEIYARNAVLIFLFYGAMHLRLYIHRSQSDHYKFSSK